MKTRTNRRLTYTSAALVMLTAGRLPAQTDTGGASGFNKQRIEFEDRYLAPADRWEEVWNYLVSRYVDNPATLAAMDPRFSASASVEDFSDTYFDTPSLPLLGMGAGVRHRKRINLTNPDDRKSGRELVQIKLSNISDSALQRGEMKFEVRRPERRASTEDAHPLLGIVRRSQRRPLAEHLHSLGIDVQALKPILTIEDRRRRVYIKCEGKPFISVSVDHFITRYWWATVEMVEIEPELNEIPYTEADAEQRRYMERINAKIIGDLTARFGYLKRDLTPKYNKVFRELERRVPMRMAARLDADVGVFAVFLIAAGLALAAVGWFAPRVPRLARFGFRPQCYESNLPLPPGKRRCREPVERPG